MHYERFCLRVFITLSILSHSSAFSNDQQIYFKHDMTNTEYDNLYCENNPLCAKWSETCKSYVKSNNDNDVQEYCHRLLRTCFKSEKCCTGKTGCCNGRCKNIYNENVMTMLINIIVIVFLFFMTYYFFRKVKQIK